MVKTRIDVDQVLRSALDTYSIEVNEILKAVREEAKTVGADAERFYPRDVALEWEAVEIATHVLDAFSDASDRVTYLMGMNVPDEACRVLVSALMLKAEDLVARARLREADPLTPREAVLLLRQEVQAINERLQTAVWAQPGPSPVLSKIRERRQIKRGTDVSTTHRFASGAP